MKHTSRRSLAAHLFTASCLIGTAGLPFPVLAQTYGVNGENGDQRAGGTGFGQGLYPGGGGPIQSGEGGAGNGGGGNGGGAGFVRGTSGGGGGGVGSGGGGGAGVRGNAQGVGEDAAGSNGGWGGNGVVGMGAGRGGGGGGGGGTAFVPVGITTVTQSYIGGQGGAGTSASLGAAGGGGGGGGIGLLADSIITLSVSAGNSVIGGNGGNGGNGSAFSNYAGGGGGGGAGGYGMYLQSTDLSNSGTIQGGNGGLGGLGATGADGAGEPGAAGAGGAGLVVGPGGGLIDNSGTIAGAFTGGHDGDEAYRASAIVVVGGTADLIFTDAAAALLGGVELQNDGELRLGSAGIMATFANTISGQGSVSKFGTTTLTLTGVNTYTGGTLVAGGVLAVTEDANLGDASGGVTLDGGTLQVAGAANIATARAFTIGASGGTLDTNGFNLTIDSGIAGTGGLTKSGLGILSLTGLSDYTGVTTISGGTLALTGFGALATTGAVELTGASAIFDMSDVTGDRTIGDLAGVAVASVVLGSHGLTVGTANDTSFAGVISGTDGTLTKAGTGRLSLTQDSINTFTGLTTIAGGTLQVDGSLAGAVTAQTSTTLKGSGEIVGLVTMNDGSTLAPGNSPGTLTVGSLLLSNRSKLLYELDTPGVVGSGVNDLTDVTGALTLDGQLSITPLTDFGTGSYRLFNYGSLTADNGLLIVSGPTGYNFEVAAGANEVNLIVNYVGLQFWNGATLAADGTVHGGPGAWNTTDTNWTDSTGNISDSWSGLTAVFAGASGGTVTLALDVAVAGLQFGVDGYELTGPGRIIVSAADTEVRVDAGITATISTEITGAGGLFKTSDGTLILSSANSYLGGTLLAAGTVQISADNNLGATAGGLSFTGGTLATTASFDTARGVALTGNGTVDVATGTTLGLTGTITGAGRLAKGGFGTLVLSGINDYAGGTLFDDGIVEISSDANLGAASGGLSFSGGTLATMASFTSARDVDIPTLGGLDVAAGTQLDLSGAISGAGMLAKMGTGALVLSGTSSVDWSIQAGSLAADAADFTGDASIGMGAAFTLNADAAASYAGTLSGFGSFTKTGAASLNYTGDGSAFSGVTTIAAGRLAVNGSLGGAVDVLAGGILGGNGTTGPVTLANGAVIAPGNSAGTLTINGDITFAPGSTYQAELAGNGTSDLISTTGQAFLNGAGLSLIALDPGVSYQNGQSYVILDAAGGVVGSFGNVTTDSIFLTASTAQQNGEVSVTVTVTNDPPGPPAPPAVFTSAAATPNQFAVAAALDTLPQVGPELGLYNALLFLNSEAEAQSGFNQLSGEAYASGKGMFIEQSALLRTAMIDRLRASFGAVAASNAPVMAYAAPYGPAASEGGMALKAAVAPAVTEKLALWTSGFGSWGEMDGNGNAASLSNSNGGFLIGADATLGAGWRLGITAGYSYTDFDVDGRNSSGDSENWHVGVYGGNQWGSLGLRTGLSYTFHDVEMSRSVGFTGFGDSLSSDYDAGTFQAFGELGYRIDTAFAAFEPFANLAYVSLHTDGFTEDGGAASLTGSSSTTDTSFTTLGLRASKTVLIGNAETTLRGALGWRHAFGDVTPLATQAFAGSEAFTVAGTPIAEDAALIEAGFDVLVSDFTTLGVAYSGQFGDGVTQNGFNATLKVTF